jgi:hypothetical protein
LFGIKNARGSAGKDELVVGRGIHKLLAVGAAGGLLDLHIAFRDHAIKLAGTGKRLTT